MGIADRAVCGAAPRASHHDEAQPHASCAVCGAQHYKHTEPTAVPPKGARRRGGPSLVKPQSARTFGERMGERCDVWPVPNRPVVRIRVRVYPAQLADPCPPATQHPSERAVPALDGALPLCDAAQVCIPTNPRPTARCGVSPYQRNRVPTALTAPTARSRCSGMGARSPLGRTRCQTCSRRSARTSRPCAPRRGPPRRRRMRRASRWRRARTWPRR